MNISEAQARTSAQRLTLVDISTFLQAVLPVLLRLIVAAHSKSMLAVLPAVRKLTAVAAKLWGLVQRRVEHR